MKRALQIVLFLLVIPYIGFSQLQLESNKHLELPRIKTPAGDLFNGELEFKFVLSYDGKSIWSNDGSSILAEEPETSISIEVEDGYIQASLGADPMKPLYSGIQSYFPKAILSAWVKNGQEFMLISNTEIDLAVLEAESTKRPEEPAAALQLSEELIAEKRQKKETAIKNDKAQDPDARTHFRAQMRNSEFEDIPMNAIVNAKKQKDRMPAMRDAGLYYWEWLGPSNIGGRVRAMIIDPDDADNIWLGGTTGGIWKTTNAGALWEPINDFLPSLTITTMAMVVGDHDIMYAGTGEGFGTAASLPGAGIFKSTDRGETWNQLASTTIANFEYVNRLAVHPDVDSTEIIYAATKSQNVYKTKDGGQSWDIVLVAGDAVLDIKVHPNLHHYLIVGTSTDVYISDDYGQSWTLHTTGAANKMPSDGGRCEVSWCSTNNGRAYVSMNRNKGELYRTSDYGATWSLRNNTDEFLGSAGWFANTIWVSPTNSNHIVVGGLDLYRSIDGGTNLTRLSDWLYYHNASSETSAHADHHIILSPPDYDYTTNPTIYVGNDGGIQRRDNWWSGGSETDWNNLANQSLGITQFYKAAVSTGGTVIVGGSQDNDNIRYRSSGAWSGENSWYQAQTGDGGWVAIDPTDDEIIYTEYVRLRIEKSIDGGDTYSASYSGILDANTSTRALFIAPFVMDPVDNDRLIAGGSRIWETENGAGGWSRIRTDIGGRNESGNFVYWRCSAIDVSESDNDIIWVGYENGNVAMTTNSKVVTPTWTRVDINGVGLPDRYVTDIDINPLDPDEVYITFGGYNADGIWYTDDGGATWQDRSGTAPYNLPSVQINTVTTHPSNTDWVYVGTDIGVFASEDGGSNWSVMKRYDEHEGPVNTEVSDLFWQDNLYLMTATFGRGMFRAQPMIVIYVDQSVAVSGNGTQGSPFKTVQEAVNVAGHGTSISIQGGTYDESQILFDKKGLITITSGSATDVIIQ